MFSIFPKPSEHHIFLTQQSFSQSNDFWPSTNIWTLSIVSMVTTAEFFHMPKILESLFGALLLLAIHMALWLWWLIYVSTWLSQLSKADGLP